MTSETAVWITVRIMWFPERVTGDKYSLCVVELIMTHSRGSRCQWIPARRSSWSSRQAGWCSARGVRTHWMKCATPAFGCHWLRQQRCNCQSLEKCGKGETISRAEIWNGKYVSLNFQQVNYNASWNLSYKDSPGAVLPWHWLVLQWSLSSEQVLPS